MTDYKPIPDAVMIPREQIYPNPNQPREFYDANELANLSDSIREKGVLQPLLVRFKPSRLTGALYMIIGGERRWRASEGVKDELPAIIKDVTDQEADELALIDNLQRSDLRALEEAKGVRALMENHGLSIAEVAKRISQARGTDLSDGWVNNRLALLKTGEDVLEVAARLPTKRKAMSSLLQADKVKANPELRANLLHQIEHQEVPFKAIKNQVDSYEHKEEERKRAERAASQSPDTHTTLRQKAHAKGENSTTSRGQLVTGHKREEINREAERALVSLAAWAAKMTETDFETLVKPTLRNLLRDDTRHELFKGQKG